MQGLSAPTGALSAAADFRRVSVSPLEQVPAPLGGSIPTRHKRAQPPFSLRLTLEERARLERDAGGMPLGAYIRSRLFDGAVSTRRVWRQPVKDHALLGQLLGALGQSRMANNLNQLAHAANRGALVVTPEVESTLRATCAALQAMRRDLMTALGLEADDRP